MKAKAGLLTFLKRHIPLVDYCLWMDHSLAEKSADYHRRVIARLQDMEVGGLRASAELVA
ncbi:hypothetical protein SAMN02927924_04464 [Sphingobium faniae]|nr:hypothetical protein SAMN02927924_04464 [Sphingobium faniae]